MINTLVSIIVPIYNVEDYLDACLQSILKQTHVNYEVLLIDDGSTDGSRIIAQNFTVKDSRFKLFSKENGGLSSARNFGLDYAKGDYICFIDSDDMVCPIFIEDLLKKALKQNADMVYCLTKVFSEERKAFLDDSYYNETPVNSVFYDRNFDHLHIRDCLFNIQVSAWNKIYKSSFLKNVSARFPIGLCFEDNLFFFRCVLNAKRISIVPAQLYIYRSDRPGSILTGRTRKYFDFFQVMNLVKAELTCSSQIWLLYKKSFFHYKYTSYLHWLRKIDAKSKKDFYMQIRAELLNEYHEAIGSVYGRRMTRKLRLIRYCNYFFYRIVKNP